ncbi:hypothetical protein OG883_02450 [Streptomyces sp. NBC_01142]|uniref:RNase A-like domain-containing protein n=1 Tax=Streptomyces sp. NBC_01142 TaxID=2975865 RepID=UPI002257A705|nr:RNase A-like domain-containing protein [Streptomyces sp. NBC_01142]MCX4818779.1 hypothetical protein [Streptomyces sp. NBC_01142]
MSTPPAPSAQNGGFDVKPSDLKRVSGIMAMQQGRLHKAAWDFDLELMMYMDCGGYGTAAEKFSSAYVEVGNKFLDVWATAVASVGGASVGFIETANHYSKAEAASHPSGTKKPTIYPRPNVIEKEPYYQRITNLKWGDMDDASDNPFSWVLEGVPDFAMDILREALDKVYRWGKVGDILPLPDYLQIDKIALAWLQPGFSVTQIDGELTGAAGSITDRSNGEWQGAMRTFASAIWGTSPWGKSTAGYEWGHDDSIGGPGGSHPVMSVLWDTTQKISKIMREFAEAAAEAVQEIARTYRKAVFEALPRISDGVGVDDLKKLGKSLFNMGKELGLGITLNIDTAALNAAVTKYEGKLSGLESRLEGLMTPLEEAYLSAPTFHAGEARAMVFGKRSLNEFKQEHQWTNPNDKNNGIYRIDLAGQEGIGNSHAIDKHTAKTDEQLLQRFRDDLRPNGQPFPGSSSTFTDPASAQRYTQRNIDRNSTEIQAWLARQPSSNPRDQRLPIEWPRPNQSSGEVTGRTVTKADYLANGNNATVNDATRVKTLLKYDGNLDPPFVVYTSYPTP